MDTQNQNQEVQPDYNFIVNQPGEPKKKMSKKVIILAILLVLLLIIIGASVLFSATNNVQNSSSGENGTEQLAETPPDITQYVEFIKAGNFHSAYGLLANIQNRPTIDVYVSFWNNYYAKNFTLSNCEIIKTTQQDSSLVTTIECPYKNEDKKSTFKAISDEKTKEITGFDYD